MILSPVRKDEETGSEPWSEGISAEPQARMEALCSSEGMAPGVSCRSSGVLGSILEEHERERGRSTHYLLTHIWQLRLHTRTLRVWAFKVLLRTHYTYFKDQNKVHTGPFLCPTPRDQQPMQTGFLSTWEFIWEIQIKIPPIELTFKVKKQITKFF